MIGAVDNTDGPDISLSCKTIRSAILKKNIYLFFGTSIFVIKLWFVTYDEKVHYIS